MAAWEWFITHPDTLVSYTLEHLSISFIALAIALPLGVGLGIYISGQGKEGVADVVLYLAEIAMTIPSLAMFGLFMLLLAALSLPVLGGLPVTIALVLYGLLPVVRNTYTGIKGVAPAVIEAGRGMGMTDRQIMLHVRLPLGIPVIMAGVRNAVVLLIGIATIGSFVGAGGLGVLIYRGLRIGATDQILVAAIAVALLALIMDGLMALLERWVTPRGLNR